MSSGGWKTVKRKKKPRRGNKPRLDLPGQSQPVAQNAWNQKPKKGGKNKPKKQNPKKFNLHAAVKQTSKKKSGPVGASGAPQAAKNAKKRKVHQKKKKSYTNEEKYSAIGASHGQDWFDPNQLHEPATGGDTTYYYAQDKGPVIEKSLADKIRKNREKRGMSRKDFAEAINETPDVVAKYEMGEVAANQRILGKMAKALNINLGRAGKKLKAKKKNKYYNRD